MKDKQVQAEGPRPGIPIISPILHVISMTGLVFLRTSFGYAFLSPKSIFLALAWAHGLFIFYASHEPGAWPKWWAIAVFGLLVIVLYLLNLLTAFGRELRRTGKHDYHSGTPHLMRLAGLFRPESRGKIETFIQLWLEPSMVLIAAALLQLGGVPRLGWWLTLVALSLWAKESINFWYRLRHQKKQSDVFRDAEESLEFHPANAPARAVSAGGRKPRQHRPRATSGAEDQSHQYAEILRLMPPYTLEQAEANYRALIRNCHPDSAGDDPTASNRAAELNTALEYFRKLRLPAS